MCGITPVFEGHLVLGEWTKSSHMMFNFAINRKRQCMLFAKYVVLMLFNYKLV
jgi:hypothetical protein